METNLNFLPEDVTLSDIPENIRPADYALQDILFHANNNLAELSVSQRKRAKLFARTLEHDTLRKKLHFRISRYTELKYTEATLRQKNHIYQEQANAGNIPAPKWQETRTSRNLEHKLMASDVEAGQPITFNMTLKYRHSH